MMRLISYLASPDGCRLANAVVAVLLALGCIACAVAGQWKLATVNLGGAVVNAALAW